jgi:hypothetical protein
MMKLIKSMWNPLGNQKAKCLQYITPLSLEMQMDASVDIQNGANELYFSSIEAEFEENLSQKTSSSAFPKVETATIDMLDKTYNKMEKTDDQIPTNTDFKTTFIKSLEVKFQNVSNSELQSKGKKFVSDIKHVMMTSL